VANEAGGVNLEIDKSRFPHSHHHDDYDGMNLSRNQPIHAIALIM
jgi:hypothetical protein